MAEPEKPEKTRTKVRTKARRPSDDEKRNVNLGLDRKMYLRLLAASGDMRKPMGWVVEQALSAYLVGYVVHRPTEDRGEEKGAA